MKTGLAYSKDCLLHTPYSGNPEVAERVLCTWEHFNEIGLLENLSTISTRPASEDDILRVHAEQHISHVKTVSEEGYGLSNYVIPDAYISPKTFDAALASAGCVMSAAESVVKGDVRNCFSLNRPPGHHSSHGPSGFCYFNNLAVAIKYSQEKLGVKKVAVFDWDAHAGNGTMDIFYKDSTVYTISIHQDPHSFYPGRGFVDEVGVGEGVGYCANIPLPAGAGDGDYIYAIDEFVAPTLRAFKPDLIFVAAGQDCHISDSISSLNVTDEGFVNMTEKMMYLADEVCGGKIVLELEGGYNLSTLPKTHEAIVKTMAGIHESTENDSNPSAPVRELIDDVRKHHVKSIR